MMINKIIPLLLILVLMLSSCASNTSTETPPTPDNYDVGNPEPLGYDFILFDSNGDGVKDDIAELTCLGMSGGYGSFKLEVFMSGSNSYRKVFDSEEYEIDESNYKKLSETIDGELMIDTFYSVEVLDTNNDGYEELICRQYAWIDYHSNHIGNVVSVFEIFAYGINLCDIYWELC